MRPLDATSSFDFTPYTLPIYENVLVRFKAADLDQEVKERAISCMGFIICHLGDHLNSEFLQMTVLYVWYIQSNALHRSTDGLFADIS